VIPAVAAACVALLGGAASFMPGMGEQETPLGERLPTVSMVFFAAMLLSIAIMPLAAAHWWERNVNKAKLTALVSLPLIGFLAFHFGRAGLEALGEKGLEYVSFMALLASLFVITGGIYVQGSLAGTPLVNTSVIGIGAVLANLVGTTGASMLLVRPLIRANEGRHRLTHVLIFFIFVVANCGGLLTPLGDPPLFLGYLVGVPFEWTLRLFPQWLLVNGLLLAVFYAWDHVALAAEKKGHEAALMKELLEHEPLRIRGLRNFLFLLGIVATVFAAGRGLGNAGQPWPFGVQEGIMIGLAVLSFLTTSEDVRRRNRFTFGPIVEVAILFAGIFITMTPALLILNVNGSRLGISQPWQYFWATGSLSSFLDNAPTYLTFAATACGSHGVPLHGRYLAEFLATTGRHDILAAISCGAVFMGANTYIGNGPNFMVKAIAEEGNVRMPSFFGYMLYSAVVLLPLFALVTLLFFRR
jgi:Na+/H+ antiporter NhaD/arsenite permease-like protein